jgi:tRNA (guanine-N7-)-methyltransferase
MEADAETNDQETHQYEARKPMWWTKLSGRRGTRAQRQTIDRMTQCGYCFSKQVLSDFSRVNISAKHSSTPEHSLSKEDDSNSAADQWRRVWWNRSLAVFDEKDAAAQVTPVIDTVTNSRNKKHAHKVQLMFSNKSQLGPQSFGQFWLEIGFGNGDNILANCKRDQKTLFIGSEIYQPGIGTVLQKMEAEMGLNAKIKAEGSDTEEKKLDTISISTEISDDALNKKIPCQNVRIIPGDGIKLLSHLPCAYLDAILITFPDPWPKEGHSRWRVVQPNVLTEMHRVLKSDGKVFVATDAECFNEWTRNIFTQESINGDWQEVTPCPDRSTWLPIVSYYEQKGTDEGRQTMLQCWGKKEHNSASN